MRRTLVIAGMMGVLFLVFGRVMAPRQCALAGTDCHTQPPVEESMAPAAGQAQVPVVETVPSAQKNLVIDGFEADIVSGPQGTIDAGSGNGSAVSVSADTQVKKDGAQALKIDYDAVSGGYMWIARGYNLDVKGASQWLTPPDQIAWNQYGAISFWVKGDAKGAKIAFDIKDAGGEMLRFMVTDDSTEWKQVVCPFSEFFPRGDWQPPTADVNGTLDFPVRSFQFEPIAVNKGVLYIDDVRLEPLN